MNQMILQRMTQIYVTMGWNFPLEGIAPASNEEDQPEESVEHALVILASPPESVFSNIVDKLVTRKIHIS
jgi:hypothetical protein